MADMRLPTWKWQACKMTYFLSRNPAQTLMVSSSWVQVRSPSGSTPRRAWWWSSSASPSSWSATAGAFVVDNGVVTILADWAVTWHQHVYR